MVGKFYRLFVDGPMDQLPWLIMHALLLYTPATLLTTLATWLTGHLSVKWRRKLVSTLQKRYCDNAAHEHIQIDNLDQRMT
jgi:ABC-type uncharacterized transport system fused permease/ATPase subunit